VVLDAVAGEDLHRPVVHLHGKVDGQLAARLAQGAAQPLIEVQSLCGKVELLLGDRPGIDLGGNLLGRHGSGHASWSRFVATSVASVVRVPRPDPSVALEDPAVYQRK